MLSANSRVFASQSKKFESKRVQQKVYTKTFYATTSRGIKPALATPLNRSPPPAAPDGEAPATPRLYYQVLIYLFIISPRLTTAENSAYEKLVAMEKRLKL